MAKRRQVPEGKQRIRVETGIYLKANGKIQVTARDPGGRQHWKEFQTVKEAQVWRARARLDPRSTVSGKRPLNEVWETFLAHHGDGLRPTTRANWEQEWRAYIAPALGEWPVGKITVLAVKDFMAALEARGVGPATREVQKHPASDPAGGRRERRARSEPRGGSGY